MTLHSMWTGREFEISPETITIVWPSTGPRGTDGTDISRNGDKIHCLESFEEMENLLKAEGLKFARVQYLEYDCLVNTDKIRYLEAKDEATVIQVGFDFDDAILVDLPLEQVINLLAAARR